MKRLYDINVHGSWFCAREVAKHMISKNTPGSLILVASMSGSVSPPFHFLHMRVFISSPVFPSFPLFPYRW